MFNNKRRYLKRNKNIPKSRQFTLKLIALSCATIMILLILCSCANVRHDSKVNTNTNINNSNEPTNLNPIIYADNFSLVFNPSDSFNPYTATSSYNLMFMPLIYDSLIKLDHNFKIVYKIADNIKLNEKVCTITLKNDILFCDGEKLTAKDVKYSFEQAFASRNFYKSQVSNIKKIDIISDLELNLTLSSPDINFINLLDIPIVKFNTANKKSTPISSGRYMINKSEQDYALIPNSYQNESSKYPIKKIHLVPNTNTENINYLLQNNTISFAYSEITEENRLHFGNAIYPVTTNNMIFLGVNANKNYLSDANIRAALSESINRSAIFSKLYSSNGYLTDVPFHPQFLNLKQSKQLLKENIKNANDLLDKSILYRKDSNNHRLFNATPTVLSILINSENLNRKYIAEDLSSQFKEIGITTKVVSVPFATYKNKIANGDYDLYIGEVKLLHNFDLTLFLNESLSYQIGVAANHNLTYLYEQYRLGTNTIDTFCDEFKKQFPFIPLFFKNGKIALSREISSNVQTSVSDLFYNIENWNLNGN